jgi:hypothetical protein
MDQVPDSRATQLPQIIVAKPQAVRIAVALLWVSLAIGVINPWLVAHGSTPEHLVAYGIFVLLCCGIGIPFVLAISAGRNWARILLLVLFVAGCVIDAFDYARLAARPTFSAAEFALQTVLQLVALCLMFSRSATPWYRRASPKG